MKLAEKILALALIAGIVLKFSLIPIGEEIIMISMLSLASIYFVFGFLLFNKIRLRDVTKKESFEKLRTTSIVIAVVVGLAMSIVCVGALFRLLSLPGGNEMLLIGVFAAIVLSIIVVVLMFTKTNINAKSILIRTIIIGFLGAVLLFTSEFSIIKLQYRNHPAYVNAYEKYKEDPSNPVSQEEMELEYNRIWMTDEEFKVYEQSLME